MPMGAGIASMVLTYALTLAGVYGLAGLAEPAPADEATVTMQAVGPSEGARDAAALAALHVMQEEPERIERINLACPRATLAEALERIERAIRTR